MKSFLLTYWDHQGRRKAIRCLCQQVFWKQMCQEPRLFCWSRSFVSMVHFRVLAHLLTGPLSEKLISRALIFIWAHGYVKTLTCISVLCAPDFSRSNRIESLTSYWSPIWVPERTGDVSKITQQCWSSPLLSFGPALAVIPPWNIWSLFQNFPCLSSTFPVRRNLIMCAKRHSPNDFPATISSSVPELLSLKYGLKIIPNNF